MQALPQPSRDCGRLIVIPYRAARLDVSGDVLVPCAAGRRVMRRHLRTQRSEVADWTCTTPAVDDLEVLTIGSCLRQATRDERSYVSASIES